MHTILQQRTISFFTRRKLYHVFPAVTRGKFIHCASELKQGSQQASSQLRAEIAAQSLSEGAADGFADCVSDLSADCTRDRLGNFGLEKRNTDCMEDGPMAQRDGSSSGLQRKKDNCLRPLALFLWPQPL